MQMKAQTMVLREFKQPLVPEEIEIPALKPGEVLVKLEASGICGSDVHMWQGEDQMCIRDRSRLEMMKSLKTKKFRLQRLRRVTTAMLLSWPQLCWLPLPGAFSSAGNSVNKEP